MCNACCLILSRQFRGTIPLKQLTRKEADAAGTASAPSILIHMQYVQSEGPTLTKSSSCTHVSLLMALLCFSSKKWHLQGINFSERHSISAGTWLLCCHEQCHVELLQRRSLTHEAFGLSAGCCCGMLQCIGLIALSTQHAAGNGRGSMTALPEISCGLQEDARSSCWP